MSASTLGSRSPPIIAAIIARPETPKMSLATTESLMQASSSSFSTRFFSALREPTRSVRYRVRSRSRRIGRGGAKLGRSICRSATLHNHSAFSTSILGRPSRCLTSRALTLQGSRPWGLQQVVVRSTRGADMPPAASPDPERRSPSEQLAPAARPGTSPVPPSSFPPGLVTSIKPGT